jgi:hypothetical protein
MNFTESFQEFSSKLSTTDLALYAGVGLVLWVLFKDKLSPVQKLLMGLVDKIKGAGNSALPVVTVPSVSPVVVPKRSTDAEDTFFKLVVSWKQTRDLAVQSGCSEAVKVADQMFPYLSPNVCKQKPNEDKVL